MQKSLHAAALLSFLFLVPACGADCESLCEDRKSCPDASPDELARDCARSCESSAKVAARMGCGAQTEDLEECIAGLDDLCDPPPDACAGEQVALFQCTHAFCTAHPDHLGCTR
jgi:hypothetical protein